MLLQKVLKFIEIPQSLYRIPITMNYVRLLMAFVSKNKDTNFQRIHTENSVALTSK